MGESRKQSQLYYRERKFGKLECFRRSNGERTVHERGGKTNNQGKIKGKKIITSAKLRIGEVSENLCFRLR